MAGVAWWLFAHTPAVGGLALLQFEVNTNRLILRRRAAGEPTWRPRHG